jgi:hypothetical protein
MPNLTCRRITESEKHDNEVETQDEDEREDEDEEGRQTRRFDVACY